MQPRLASRPPLCRYLMYSLVMPEAEAKRQIPAEADVAAIFAIWVGCVLVALFGARIGNSRVNGGDR